MIVLTIYVYGRIQSETVAYVKPQRLKNGIKRFEGTSGRSDVALWDGASAAATNQISESLSVVTAGPIKGVSAVILQR